MSHILFVSYLSTMRADFSISIRKSQFCYAFKIGTPIWILWTTNDPTNDQSEQQKNQHKIGDCNYMEIGNESWIKREKDNKKYAAPKIMLDKSFVGWEQMSALERPSTGRPCFRIFGFRCFSHIFNIYICIWVCYSFINAKQPFGYATNDSHTKNEWNSV